MSWPTPRPSSWFQIGMIVLSIGFAVSVRKGWIQLGFITPLAVSQPAEYREPQDPTEKSATNEPPTRPLYTPRRENRIAAFEDVSILKLTLKRGSSTSTLTYEGAGGLQYRVPVEIREADWITREKCDSKSLRVRFTDRSTKNPLWAAAKSSSFLMVSACTKKAERTEQEKLLEQHLQYRILETAGFAVPRVRLVWLTTEWPGREKTENHAQNYAMIVEPDEDLAYRYGWKVFPTSTDEAAQDRLNDLIAKDRFDPRALSHLRVANLFLANPDYSIYGYRTYVMGSATDSNYIEAWIPFGFENTGLTSGRSEIFNFTEEESFRKSLPALFADPDAPGFDRDSLIQAAGLFAQNEAKIRRLIAAHPIRHREKFQFHMDQWMTAWKAFKP